MKKRIISVLSMLVCLCMVYALNPITSLAEGTTYGLWVGGVEVTSENKDDITGSGISGGKVSYDPTSKTLTLNNVNITGIQSFYNAMGTDSAGIYYAGDDSNENLNINLIGANSICVTLGTSDISCYGIYDKSFYQGLTITGNGSLTVQSGDTISGDRYSSWSVGIFSRTSIIVGTDCTITATSATADISAAIYNYDRLTATHSKVTAGNSADSATEVDITSDYFDLSIYKYMKIEPTGVHTHILTCVSEKPATCTEDGNTAYYVCSGCGNWYTDAEGNQEITDRSSVKILHTGHDWAAAEKGSKYEECKTCGYKKTAVEIPATGPQSPQTGDNNSVGIYMVIMLFALAVIAAAIMLGKKNRRIAK